MAEPEQGRTEQATPFKLREARKRGTVAKSVDVLTFTAVLALAIVIAMNGRGVVESEAAVARAILSAAGDVDLAGPALIGWLGTIGYASLKPLMPLFVLVLIVGVIAFTTSVKTLK